MSCVDVYVCMREINFCSQYTHTNTIIAKANMKYSFTFGYKGNIYHFECITSFILLIQANSIQTHTQTNTHRHMHYILIHS